MAIPRNDPTAPVFAYPVMLTLAGRRCLVVGAGPVGTGKVGGLLRAQAQVTVVAPRMGQAMEELAGRHGTAPAGAQPGPGTLELHHRPYRPGEVAAYDLVVTATGVSAVDAAVVADAMAAGVLVNSADRQTPGTVTLPAVHREGPVTVAVSTGGSSPALAAWLRDRIAAGLPPGLATVAGLLEEARARRPAATAEPVDWAALIEHELLPLVAAGRIEEARARLLPPAGPAGPPGPS